MNPKDRETLAAAYAKRRIREGHPPVEAVLYAQVVYGLTGPAVKRLKKQLEATT